MSTNLKVSWVDRGVEPVCPPDPEYPDGVDLDCSKGREFCETELEYPAPRCGYYVIACDVCGLTCLVTTAGRRDDPRSIKLACKTIDVVSAGNA
jgi:hypothetical protein